MNNRFLTWVARASGMAAGLGILASGAAFAVTLSGAVMGGGEPIENCAVSAFSVSGKGSKALATATTNSAGAFKIRASASRGSVLYLIAAGGSYADGGVNPAIKLMSVVGISASHLPKQIVINELTTIASVSGMAQFIDATGAMTGSSLSLVNAASGVLSIVNPATGQPEHALSIGANSPAQIETLADILWGCVSSGSQSSAGCAGLFSAVTPISGAAPADTLAAAFSIARNPEINPAGIFALLPSSAPFSQVLSTAPGDWSISLNFSSGAIAAPAALAIDATGNVWIANSGGSVVKLGPNGNQASKGSGFVKGGLANSFALAVDLSGDVWVINKYTANGEGSVTELSSRGSPLSGKSGLTGGGMDYPVAIATDSSGLMWVANFANASVTIIPKKKPKAAVNLTGGGLSFPLAIAIDLQSRVWVANQGNNSVTIVVPNGSGGYSAANLTGGGLDSPSAIASDSAGNIWVTNLYGNSVTVFDSAGTPTAGSPLSANLDGPDAIAIDGAGNAWVASLYGSTISEINSSSSAAFTGMGLDQADSIAIDPSGDVWVANYDGNSVTKFFSLATPVASPLVGPAKPE